MKSATTGSPVISASSLNVSPVLQSAERLPAGTVAVDRGMDRAAQDDAEVRGLVALAHDDFAELKRLDPRVVHQGLETIGGDLAERTDLVLEKRGNG